MPLGRLSLTHTMLTLCTQYHHQYNVEPAMNRTPTHIAFCLPKMKRRKKKTYDFVYIGPYTHIDSFTRGNDSQCGANAISNAVWLVCANWFSCYHCVFTRKSINHTHTYVRNFTYISALSGQTIKLIARSVCSLCTQFSYHAYLVYLIVSFISPLSPLRALLMTLGRQS